MDIIEHKNEFDNIVVIYQESLYLIDPVKGSQFPDGGTLGGCFESQRSHDSLKGIPMFNESLPVDLSVRFDKVFVEVVLGRTEAHQLCRLFWKPAITGSEPITRTIEDGKIDFVRSVRIS